MVEVGIWHGMWIGSVVLGGNCVAWRIVTRHDVRGRVVEKSKNVGRSSMVKCMFVWTRSTSFEVPGIAGMRAGKPLLEDGRPAKVSGMEL